MVSREILCSRDTMRAVGDSYDYGDVIWVTPKGSTRRVPVMSLREIDSGDSAHCVSDRHGAGRAVEPST